MKKKRSKASVELTIGDIVNYHSIIGGEITTRGHTITAIEYSPNNYGCDVAWIKGKSGCVALRSLSGEG